MVRWKDDGRMLQGGIQDFLNVFIFMQTMHIQKDRCFIMPCFNICVDVDGTFTGFTLLANGPIY